MLPETDLFPEVPSVAPLTGDDERYTLPETIELCRKLAGVKFFDLDVAACRESHCAERYFTLADDGLKQDWRGESVWCNPPWSTIEPWLVKGYFSVADGHCSALSMLLPGNRTEQPFWQQHVERVRDGRARRGPVRLTTNFLPGRTRYGSPGDRYGIHAGSPNFTSVLLVWRAR